MLGPKADLGGGGGGGGVLWMLKHPPPNFYHVQARKLLEVANCILYVCMDNEKMERAGRMANLYLELLRGAQIILLV